tara:strand:- start:240 stop:1004 length:765 start_codon:yes stop_codon:yes gene_type:complete
LQFAVQNFQDDNCDPVDIETADITIVLKVNGTTITDPLIYNTSLGIIYWDKWKPTADDVYTADVTLNCIGGGTYTQSYSYTIPNPANTTCVCCTELTPDYLVISGGTGCCAMANGTWALSATGGSCAFGTKGYGYTDNDIYGAPGSPCGGGECYSVVDGGSGRTYYFWKRGIQIAVTMPPTAGPDNITITVSCVYRVYYGSCTSYSSTVTATYTYTLTCSGGNAGTGSGGSVTLAFGFSATPCASAPTVELFFA